MYFHGCTGRLIPTGRLHFVRNHAAVPQLHWETHVLSVYSKPQDLLLKPRQLTMDELTSGDFKILEIPVTMGCDGSAHSLQIAQLNLH